MSIKSITGIVVSWNDSELLKESIGSLRRVHPSMKIIVVDGSPEGSKCWAYAKTLRDKLTKVYLLKYNIGHGKGLDFGIKKAKTKYVLLFDSDIVVKQPFAEVMLNCMDEDLYGMGMIEQVCKDGMYHKSKKDRYLIPYLHPYFALVNRKKYFEYPPFIHHGSPWIMTMNTIHSCRKKLIKAFPTTDFVIHKKRGTRTKDPKEFRIENWDQVPNFLTIITRKHPFRDKCYKEHRESLLSQTDLDFYPLIIYDKKGRGVPWANRQLYECQNKINSDYVFILDDDDKLIDRDFIKDIKEIVQKHNPDVIMVKMERKGKIYPTDISWKKDPKFANIVMSNFIVRSSIYKKYAKSFCVDQGADFYFIREVLKHPYKVHWEDKVYSKVMVVSKGGPEKDYSLQDYSSIQILDNNITAITCTGDRPEAFEMCVKWMQRQTVKPKQWIVVDDGKVKLKSIPDKCTYIRRIPSENDPPHTLCLNLLEGLNHTIHPKIIIIEDDDWYCPDYIKIMSKELNENDLVGVQSLLFYSAQLPGYSFRNKVRHPALFQTAFRSSIVPYVQKICLQYDSNKNISHKGLIDSAVWENKVFNQIKNKDVVVINESIPSSDGTMVPKGHKFYAPFPNFIKRRLGKTNKVSYLKSRAVKKILTPSPDKPLAVGMKGLPGRPGLTQAQKSGHSFYKCDNSYLYLRQVIGEDYKYYERFKNEKGK